MEIRKITVGPYEENCYVLVCPKTRESVIVDPGAEAQKILDAAKDTGVKLIVITHGHPDHVGALAAVRSALNVPVAYHPADAQAIPLPAEKELEGGETLTFGTVQLQVIHTPGHTPGSICLYKEGDLIAGDTIFPGGPGHTNTPEDFEQIVATIREKVFILPRDTMVYSGHGVSTTVGAELPQFEAFLERQRPSNLCGDVTWAGAY